MIPVLTIAAISIMYSNVGLVDILSNLNILFV